MAIRITKSIQERVKAHLQKTKFLRDSDPKLITRIWAEDIKKSGIQTPIALDKLEEMISEGKITNGETIRRSRQKIQKENPELRGKNYRGRQSHQTTVKKDLGYKS